MAIKITTSRTIEAVAAIIVEIIIIRVGGRQLKPLGKFYYHLFLCLIKKCASMHEPK